MIKEEMIPRRIRNIRLACKMTQQELADAVCVTKGYISKIETGASAPPVGTLIAFAQALKVDLNAFFEAEDPEVYVAVNAYEKLWGKLNQAFTTAPHDTEGNPQPSFMKYLVLLYTPEEADVMQHMLRPVQFAASKDIAAAAGKNVEYLEEVLNGVHRKNGLMVMGNFYALPPAPLLLNNSVFYTEIKPDDLKAAELYQDFSGTFRKTW